MINTNSRERTSAWNFGRDSSNNGASSTTNNPSMSPTKIGGVEITCAKELNWAQNQPAATKASNKDAEGQNVDNGQEDEVDVDDEEDDDDDEESLDNFDEGRTFVGGAVS